MVPFCARPGPLCQSLELAPERPRDFGQHTAFASETRFRPDVREQCVHREGRA